MHDSKILKACILSRAAYDKVKDHLSEKDFTPQVSMWWELVKEWYTQDADATAIDLDILRDRADRKFPEKHKESLMDVVDNMSDIPSIENVVREVLDLKRFNAEMTLGAMIASRDPKDKIFKQLQEVNELHQATSLSRSEIKIANSLEDLDNLYARENLIKIPPKALNDAIGGGAVKGDHIVVFARPEYGKTLFVVNMTAGFLKQKLKVLYIGNEDAIEKIQYRIRSNLSNFSREQIEEGGKRAVAEANRRARARNMESHLILVHLHPGSVAEIESLLDEYSPDVLILDQIRNIGGGTDLTARLNQVAIQVRALLGKYNVLGVSVTQAYSPEGGRPRVWLGLEDVDSSKTGLPAQADLMIGIGGDEAMLTSNSRAISLCKNKLNNNHKGFLIRVDPYRSKVI